MASNVTELIGRSVVKAEGSLDGTLTLAFQGGATLQFLDSLPNYESYQIIGIGTPIPVMGEAQLQGVQKRVII